MHLNNILFVNIFHPKKTEKKCNFTTYIDIILQWGKL